MKRVPLTLQRFMDENKLMAVELPQNPMYEVGKSYWSGYWSRQYTVLEVKTETHGKNTFLNSVTVQEQDGRIHNHGTPLDPKSDWEIRKIEPILVQPPVIGQLTFRHGYADEPVSYTDSAELLKDLKEALDTRGPNGISVQLRTSDTELHYEVYALEAGEYGYTVDKDKYLALAKEFGLKAPELEKAIVDESQMDMMPTEEDDLRSLALQMEQANTEEGLSIGKITLHHIEKEINYVSSNRLQQDYLNAISKFGVGAISATLLVEDHELSYTLAAAEAKDLGFTLDKDKYMELVAIYGQGAQELTQAAVEDEWDGPKWGQEVGELEL